jgi:lysophospholipase L1-like esterase
MPANFFPEGTQPLASDSVDRSLKKINALLESGGGGSTTLASITDMVADARVRATLTDEEVADELGGFIKAKPSLVAVLGDSITNQNSTASVTNGRQYAAHGADGFAVWAQTTLKGRFNFLRRSELFSDEDFGTDGFKINQIRGTSVGDETARTATEVMGSNSLLSQLAARCSGKNVLVVILAGTNDVGDLFTYTFTQIANKHLAMQQELINCGIPASKIVVMAVPPRNNVAITTFGDNMNAVLATGCAALGTNYVPYPAAMKTAGQVTASWVRDGIHPNPFGAQGLGNALATAIDSLIAPEAFPMPPSSDARWLNANPYATGTQAVSGTRYSGNIPTSWSVPLGGPGVNTTWVLSKVTDSEGEWQRIVSTGSDRVGGTVLQTSATGVVPPKTKFRLVARVKGSGFLNVRIYCIYGTVVTELLAPGSWLEANSPNDLAAFDGVLVSPVVEASSLQTTPVIWIGPQGQGTLDIRQVGILRVSDDTLSVPSGDQSDASTTFVNTTLTSVDQTVLASASSTLTVTLPAAASNAGRKYTIKKIDDTANTVVVDANASETIDGATTQTLTSQFDAITIQCNGTSWFILARVP